MLSRACKARPTSVLTMHARERKCPFTINGRQNGLHSNSNGDWMQPEGKT